MDKKETAMLRSVLVVVLFCMILAPLFAGSFSSAEHRFDFQWADEWSVNDRKTDAQMLVDLVKENRGFSFQIAVHPIEIDSLGKDYLASERSVEQVYKNTGKKKMLLDEMVKVSGYPARKVIYESPQKMIIGLVLTLANDRLYMLVSVRANPDFKYFQKEFDRMVSNFSIKGDFGSDF
jgi:hypothetical protein